MASNLSRCFLHHDAGWKPFQDEAVAVITQLGAFSLQFRSRSGSVFVARWRSGLTIGVRLPSRSHPPGIQLVSQKKRYNFIWQRRDATPERLLCVFHVYVYRRTRTRGALNAGCALCGYKFCDALAFISKREFVLDGVTDRFSKHEIIAFATKPFFYF